MYFFNIDIFIKQILPPSWRYIKVPDGEGGFLDKLTGKFYFIKSILKPCESILSDFKIFRKDMKSKINLTPQVMIIENHLRHITGLDYGVYISDTGIGEFTVNLPSGTEEYENEILLFLKSIIPMGRRYELNFY